MLSSRLRHAAVRTAAAWTSTPVQYLVPRAWASVVSHPSEAFLNGTNAVYMEEMYRVWSADPAKVHASWDAYFTNVEAGLGPGQAFIAPPALQPGVSPVPLGAASGAGAGAGGSDKMRITHLIRAFQVQGHKVASLDPLGLSSVPVLPELDPASYGFSEGDMDKPFDTTGFAHMKGFLGVSTTATLRELLQRLQSTYCGSTGWQYMHISCTERCNWLRERIELAEPPALSKEEKVQIFDRLAHAHQLEAVLAKKFNTAKRFGLEGVDTLIPGIKALVDRSTQHGVKNIVMGMPHRGRLNVLVNVVRKPMEVLFREFKGAHVEIDEYLERLEKEEWTWSGDVKYHLGTSYDRTYEDGREVHLSLAANPSHLETVNPVVQGKARAKQDADGDVHGKRTMPVLMHGDAAFAGQGVVYETLQMAKLQGFTTGGTVHVIANNQVGFTTNPTDSRSTPYCSDLGKAFDMPIFHVNADDPEAVHHAFVLAADYRAEFGEDILIDLVGYRRNGHNELDPAEYTQPIMTAAIKQHPSAMQLYGQKLQAEGTLSAEEAEGIPQGVWDTFLAAYDASDDYVSKQEDWLATRWKGFFTPHQVSPVQYTGVDPAELEAVAEGLSRLPEGFALHRNLQRIRAAEAKKKASGGGVNWGTAEALAYGTLLREGYNVRLTGQDVNRGTFSHRHARVFDQKTEESFAPLSHLSDVDGKEQGQLHIYNSHLSEYGVLGFEVGYALDDPQSLVLWEAQFGDFVNGAQIIIDQYISSGEDKWMRQCGITMLLPHGYEGMGPEHSSARVERFLQAMDTDEDKVPRTMAEDARKQIQHANMQVVCPSTPANFFHVLRRQQHREFRKPLVVITPKSLLRLPKCSSTMDQFETGTKFMRFIPDDCPTAPSSATVAPEAVRKLLLCTGKMYYELEEVRAGNEAEGKAPIGDVAIARVEQLAPFPFDAVAAECAKYPNAEVVWVQEEPKNMGAWAFVQPRIETATLKLNKEERRPEYVGRRPAPAPATGLGQVHALEQQSILKDAFA